MGNSTAQSSRLSQTLTVIGALLLVLFFVMFSNQFLEQSSVASVVAFNWRPNLSSGHNSTADSICQNVRVTQFNACSLYDASRYFACHGKYLRTGSFIPNTKVWQPYPGCEAKQQALQSCLFEPRARHTSRGNYSHYIVAIGDSQANRYVQALVSQVERVGASCKRLRQETTDGARGGDPVYFGVPNATTMQLDCAGCASHFTVCTAPQSNVTVWVEYVRMEFILDFEMRTKPRLHWNDGCDIKTNPTNTPCKWAWSTQQFLFEEYFGKIMPLPTQLHIFQNIHDPVRRKHADYKRDLHWFIDLLNSTIGQHSSTELFFWEATCPSAALQGVWGGVTTKKFVSFMNAATKEAILPWVQETVHLMVAGTYHARQKAAWHATYNIFEPSMERLDLVLDGVHLAPEWYDVASSEMLRGYCGGLHGAN